MPSRHCVKFDGVAARESAIGGVMRSRGQRAWSSTIRGLFTLAKRQRRRVGCDPPMARTTSTAARLVAPALPVEHVVRGRHEQAGATVLAPHALVARGGGAVVVVACDELSIVDPQLAVEEVELLDA